MMNPATDPVVLLAEIEQACQTPTGRQALAALLADLARQMHHTAADCVAATQACDAARQQCVEAEARCEEARQVWAEALAELQQERAQYAAWREHIQHHAWNLVAAYTWSVN
jgi:hypothetical protein